jgi:hypothetical protein
MIKLSSDKYSIIRIFTDMSRYIDIYLFINKCRGPGDSVGIATGYGLEGRGNEFRWERDFSHLFRPALGYTQPGRDADISPLLVPKSKTRVELYLYFPQGPSSPVKRGKPTYLNKCITVRYSDVQRVANITHVLTFVGQLGREAISKQEKLINVCSERCSIEEQSIEYCGWTCFDRTSPRTTLLDTTLTLREERRLRVFENRVLRGFLGLSGRG